MTTASAVLENAVRIHQSGDLGQARDLYCQVLAADPTNGDALHFLGLIAFQAGQHSLALEFMEKALPLGGGTASQLNNLGEVYRTLGRLSRAETSYREAIRLQPTMAEAHTNLGSALRDQGRLDEAQASYRSALQLRSQDPVCLNNLGNVLKDQGRIGEAISCYREALRLRPDYAVAQTNFLFSQGYNPDITPEALAAEHRAWGNRYRHLPVPVHTNTPDPDRPLRIGYVSGDFRSHAVARFLEPILRHHDPRQSCITLYGEVAAPDAVTARLKSLVHAYRSTCGLSDTRLASQIRADGIDLLIDLAGHTSGHRLGAFALSPAPVQMTYLGYPNTTGLPQMTYRLTDAITDPPGSESRFTEELIRLDPCLCCFALPDDAPPASPSPALRNGYLTFGSPHNLAKLNPLVLDLWAQVLNVIPDSRLTVFRTGLSGSVRVRLFEEFAHRGIPSSRIAMQDVAITQIGYGGYLKLFDEVDIVLDTFPAGSHTTACEALAMGVPVLTLAGDRTFGRLCASVLHRVGLANWVTATPAEFVQRAIAVAKDLRGLACLRRDLPERVAATLGDAVSFADQLAVVSRRLWQRWCRSSVAPLSA